MPFPRACSCHRLPRRCRARRRIPVPNVGGWKPPLLGLRRFNIDATEFNQVLRWDATAAFCPFTSGEMNYSYHALPRACSCNRLPRRCRARRRLPVPTVGGWKPPLLGLRRFHLDATEFNQVLRRDAVVALCPFTSGEMDYSYYALPRACSCHRLPRRCRARRRILVPTVGGWKPPLLGLRRFHIDATEFNQVLRRDAVVALCPSTSGEMD